MRREGGEEERGDERESWEREGRRELGEGEE